MKLHSVTTYVKEWFTQKTGVKVSRHKEDEIRKIAHRLYANRQRSKGEGSVAEDNWAKAQTIQKSRLRKFFFYLNQPLISIEKRGIEPLAQWMDRADIFRIFERLGPMLEGVGVIAIPIVLAFAAQRYQENMRQQDLRQLQQQAITDYLEQLSTILLELEGDFRDLENERLRTVSTATTLTLLRDPNLDGKSKGQVISFLAEMRLLQTNFVYGPQHPREDTSPVIILGDVDLQEAYLHRINLSGASLSEANLSHTYLVKANLSGANLSYANLSGADLSGADLSGADLTMVDLKEARLGSANLKGAYLGNIDFSETYLYGANFTAANLFGSVLNETSLYEANLTDADLSHTILDEVDLNGAFLCRTRLPHWVELNPDRDCGEYPNPPIIWDYPYPPY